MRSFIFFLLLTVLAPQIDAQKACENPERPATPLPSSMLESLIKNTPDGVHYSNVFVQVDYDIVEDKGLAEAKLWATELMETSAVPYGWIDVDLCFLFDFLEVPTYTEGNSYEMLRQFKEMAAGMGADVAIMLSYKSSGGIAWVDEACKASSEYKYSFANVNPDFTPWEDGYNWNPEVIAHELGHLYGCQHTQQPIYTIDGVPNQAIDGCYPIPGTTAGPIPVDGGTIMSYCHLHPTGINFDKGFHPINAAIIRAKAAGNCLSCDGAPNGGGGDPPTAECKGNAVYINIFLDAYPSETSYMVTNSQGDTIHQRGPFPRYKQDGTTRMQGEVIADTICLPDGCYAFHIIDPNGLIDEGSCMDGMYYVGDNFGPITEGASFTNMETSRFCLNVDPPEPTCYTVSPDTLKPYSNQNRRGGYTANEGEIVLSGNNWLASELDYDFTPQTILNLDVMRGDTGEIHAVGIVNEIESLNPANMIRFGGTQEWGLRIDYIPKNEWTSISIPVGEWLPAIESGHIVFVNDYDPPTGNAITGFRKIELCEGGSGMDAKARPQVQGKASDEDYTVKLMGDSEAPFPNPVTDTIHLRSKAVWFLYSSSGKMVETGYSSKINVVGLPSGVYYVHIGGRTYKVIKS